MVDIWSEDDLSVVLSVQTHLRNYREFVLKFMLMHGYESTHEFKPGHPLWDEYTQDIHFIYVIQNFLNVHKRRLSREAFDIIMSTGENGV